jgi:hypothetical protein
MSGWEYSVLGYSNKNLPVDVESLDPRIIKI